LINGTDGFGDKRDESVHTRKLGKF